MIEASLTECLDQYTKSLDKLLGSEGLPDETCKVITKQLVTNLSWVASNAEQYVEVRFDPAKMASEINVAPEVVAYGLEDKYRKALEHGCSGLLTCIDLCGRWQGHAWSKNFRDHDEFREIQNHQTGVLEDIQRIVKDEPAGKQRDLETSYRNLLIDRYNRVPLGTLAVTQIREIKLGTLYVPQKVKKLADELPSAKELEELHEQSQNIQDVRDWVLGLRGMGGTGYSVPALEVLTQGRRVVITGAPGSGKSTLLQYIALQALRGRLKFDHAKDSPLPILMRLRSLEDRHFRNDTLDLSVEEMLVVGEGIQDGRLRA